MAKNKAQGKQTESPQVARRQYATQISGGKSPSAEDVVKSANARSTDRHEVKGRHLADVGFLADSAHMEGNERVGIQNDGYRTTKDLEFGVQAMYNSLPPGMDIEDQENCDIRQMPMKTVVAMGFPGDGWTDGTDRGRPQTTNYGARKGG